MTGPRARNILIVALGGEGGGVLADWIVHCAHASGLPVQATSVPGVAQRTGCTSYYIEYLDEAPADGRRPVFALTPTPGCVDVVLASELLEAGRAIELGFVDPQRTLLISARHRVLTTQEKLAMGDGRHDERRLLDAAQALAARCLLLDLRGIAERHRTVVSAVMFGALAGSGRLPWPRPTCEAAIRDGGVGVAASLAGFAEAFEAASCASGTAPSAPSAPSATSATPVTSAKPATPTTALPLERVIELGAARLQDYQDAAYAGLYRERVASLVAAQGAAPGGAEAQAAVAEAARGLALWMGYEDVIRVADLKTRASRLARVREEAAAGPDDVVEIREHLKPSLEELAAIAPRRLGLVLRARARARRDAAGAAGRGLTLATTSIHGFALLRLVAGLRRWRRASLRFAQEQRAIEAWLDALRFLLPRHGGAARQLAELPRLRKGYGDTHTRGLAAYERIFAACVAPLLDGTAPVDDAASAALASASQAALADPEHAALDLRIGRGTPAAQPVVFMPRARRPLESDPSG